MSSYTPKKNVEIEIKSLLNALQMKILPIVETNDLCNNLDLKFLQIKFFQSHDTDSLAHASRK